MSRGGKAEGEGLGMADQEVRGEGDEGLKEWHSQNARSVKVCREWYLLS